MTNFAHVLTSPGGTLWIFCVFVLHYYGSAKSNLESNREVSKYRAEIHVEMNTWNINNSSKVAQESIPGVVELSRAFPLQRYKFGKKEVTKTKRALKINNKGDIKREEIYEFPTPKRKNEKPVLFSSSNGNGKVSNKNITKYDFDDDDVIYDRSDDSLSTKNDIIDESDSSEGDHIINDSDDAIERRDDVNEDYLNGKVYDVGHEDDDNRAKKGELIRKPQTSVRDTIERTYHELDRKVLDRNEDDNLRRRGGERRKGKRRELKRRGEKTKQLGKLEQTKRMRNQEKESEKEVPSDDFSFASNEENEHNSDLGMFNLNYLESEQSARDEESKEELYTSSDNSVDYNTEQSALSGEEPTHQSQIINDIRNTYNKNRDDDDDDDVVDDDDYDDDAYKIPEHIQYGIKGPGYRNVDDGTGADYYDNGMVSEKELQGSIADSIEHLMGWENEDDEKYVKPEASDDNNPVTVVDVQDSNESPDTVKHVPDESPATVKHVSDESPDTVKHVTDESPDTVKHVPDESLSTVKHIPGESPDTLKHVPDESLDTVKHLPDESAVTMKHVSFFNNDQKSSVNEISSNGKHLEGIIRGKTATGWSGKTESLVGRNKHIKNTAHVEVNKPAPIQEKEQSPTEIKKEHQKPNKKILFRNLKTFRFSDKPNLNKDNTRLVTILKPWRYKGINIRIVPTFLESVKTNNLNIRLVDSSNDSNVSPNSEMFNDENVRQKIGGNLNINIDLNQGKVNSKVVPENFQTSQGFPSRILNSSQRPAGMEQKYKQVMKIDFPTHPKIIKHFVRMRNGLAEPSKKSLQTTGGDSRNETLEIADKIVVVPQHILDIAVPVSVNQMSNNGRMSTGLVNTTVLELNHNKSRYLEDITDDSKKKIYNNVVTESDDSGNVEKQDHTDEPFFPTAKLDLKILDELLPEYLRRIKEISSQYEPVVEISSDTQSLNQNSQNVSFKHEVQPFVSHNPLLSHSNNNDNITPSPPPPDQELLSFQTELLTSLKFSLEKDPLSVWMYSDQSKLEHLKIKAGQLKKGIANLGEPQRLKRVLKKAFEGRDVKLSIVAGSISAGGGLWKDRGDLRGLYFKAFVDWWDKIITPVTNSRLTVNSMAIGGSSSEYFSYCMKNYLDGEPDIVLWELAANDYLRYVGKGFNQAQPLEQLTRVILTLPSKPALILVNFFRGDAFDKFVGCPNSEDEGGEAIARHYKITSLSWRDLICDSLTSYIDSVTKKQLFCTDGYHPNLLAHSQMAYLLISYVKDVFEQFVDEQNQALALHGALEDFAEEYEGISGPLFKDPVIPQPLCWTLLTPDFSHKYRNTLPHLRILYADGFVLRNITRWSVRTDQLRCLEAMTDNAKLELHFTIPMLAEDLGKDVSDAQGRKVLIASHNSYGGSAKLTIDQDPNESRIISEDESKQKRVQVDLVATNISPGGGHLMTIRVLRKGFCLSSIMVI